MKPYLLALVLVLSACQSQPEEPAPVPLTVEVDGDLGSPRLSTVGGDLPDGQTTLTDVEGLGRELTAESPILYTVSSFNDDGELLAGGETPILASVGDAPIEAVGMSEGSRVLTINPQEGGAEIIVVDILHTSVQGQARELSGPLTVTVGDDGTPLVTGTVEISRLSTQVVVRGDGPQVGEDDDVYVQYSVYRDGELVDSTWGQGPILLDLNDTFEGVRTSVTESFIGSRLLIQVPAAQAQGTADLVVLIDLLAIG